MLTPIHVLVTVALKRNVLRLVEHPQCPMQIRMAVFEMLAFFFPKVNIFRNIKDTVGQNFADDVTSKEQSKTPNTDDVKAAISIKESCTAQQACYNETIELPKPLEEAVIGTEKVTQSASHRIHE